MINFNNVFSTEAAVEIKPINFKFDDLKDYILGLYSVDVDAGHGKWHISNVCDNFDNLFGFFPELQNIDSNILKLGVALHDIGLSASALKTYLHVTYPNYEDAREAHHINSAKIFLVMLEKDPVISKYKDYILPYKDMIAHSIEHHRASVNQETPLDNLYRCCDGLNTPNTMVVRSMLYNLNHYPERNYEETAKNVQTHTINKYLGPNAYCDKLPNENVNKYFKANLKIAAKVFYDKDFVVKGIRLLNSYYDRTEKDEMKQITSMELGVSKIYGI